MLLSTNFNIATSTGGAVPWDVYQTNGLELTFAGGDATLPCGMYLIMANIVCRDTATESFNANILIRQDGAQVALSGFTIGSVTGGEGCTTPVMAYVHSTGSSVIQTFVELYGSAGTLFVASQSQLLIMAL
jgi:hypothetical protein